MTILMSALSKISVFKVFSVHTNFKYIDYGERFLKVPRVSRSVETLLGIVCTGPVTLEIVLVSLAWGKMKNKGLLLALKLSYLQSTQTCSKNYKRKTKLPEDNEVILRDLMIPREFVSKLELESTHLFSARFSI